MKIINTDYLTWEAKEDFDLVIMNPPFNVGSKMILKAASELKDGGTLAFIMKPLWRTLLSTKNEKGIIYPALCEQGAFKSIYSIDQKETTTYFNGAATAVDLVIWIKGEKPGKVWVRNNRGADFTYDQNSFKFSPPMIDPVKATIWFDMEAKESSRSNPTKGGIKVTANNLHTNHGKEIYTIHERALKKQEVMDILMTPAEYTHMMQPKLIVPITGQAQLDIGFQVDLDGSKEIGQNAFYIPGSFDPEKVAALNKFMRDNEMTLAYNLGGPRSHLPKIRLSKLI